MKQTFLGFHIQVSNTDMNNYPHPDKISRISPVSGRINRYRASPGQESGRVLENFWLC